MRKLINPITISIIAALIYLGLILWSHELGVQHGKDYMVSHYQVLGVKY